MDQPSLNKYFPGEYREDMEALSVSNKMEASGRVLAELINQYLPESQAKGDILGRLFRVIVDAELALRMDGVSTTQNMIVLTKQ